MGLLRSHRCGPVTWGQLPHSRMPEPALPVKSSIRGINDRTNTHLPNLPHRDQADGVAGGAADRRHAQAVRGPSSPEKRPRSPLEKRPFATSKRRSPRPGKPSTPKWPPRLDQERGSIAAAEAQKAKRLVAIDLDARVKEIADLNEVLRQRDAKLAEAQQAQADLIRKQRELDDAKREMDLTIQKQVQAELGAVRDQAKQETEAALTLRVREKEEQIASMQRQIEDLKRKAEQGSQQLQGEVQELALEALLRQRFPRDLSSRCRRANSAAT